MMHGGFIGGGSHRRGMAGRTGLDREEDDDGQLYDHTVVRRLFKYLTPYWPKLLLTLAAVMVYTGTVVALPWMVAKIIDDYVREGRPVRPQRRRTDLRRPGAAPVRKPVRPHEDDGLRRAESPLHPARATLQPPAAPVHELLQQERGWPGDVQGPERRAAAPGVPVNRHRHRCGRAQPRRNHHRHDADERPTCCHYPDDHPSALRDVGGLAEVRPQSVHEGAPHHLRRQRRTPGEHFRGPRRPEHEPRAC